MYATYHKLIFNGVFEILQMDIRLTNEACAQIPHKHKFLIIENAFNLILNMVPDAGKKNSDAYKILKAETNWLQPLEILSGHCVLDFHLFDN